MSTIIAKRTSDPALNIDHARLLPDEQRQPARSTRVGYVFGLWLSSVFLVASFGRIYIGSSEGLILLQAISINWPLIYFAFSKHRFIPARITSGKIIALVLFCLFTIGSVGISPLLNISLSYFLLTMAAIILALQFNTALTPDSLEKGLKVSSFLTLLCLLAFTHYEYVPGVRLGNATGILNPNAIGIVAISVMIGAMAYKKLMLRVIIIALAGMVIFLTGSRATGIASILGLTVIFIMRYRSASLKRKVSIIGAVVLLSCVAVFYMEVILRGAESYLAIDHSHRGLDSGATGRIWAWKETWKLFLDHPIFGVGFRVHSHFLTLASSSHNGYLALLAEVGVIAFASVVYLIFSGILDIRRRLRDEAYFWTETVMLGLVVGCLFLAIFERFLINIGNPTSLLLIVAILRPIQRGINR